MDRVARKKNEKYLSLITSAFELFEIKDFQSVSLDEIVKKAGVAKGTFYLYFNDKFDLISKMIIKKATEYMDVEIDLPEITDDMAFSQSVKNYTDLIVDFLEKNKTLTLLIDKNVHICVNTVIEHRDGAIKEMYDKIFSYFVGKGFSEEKVSTKLYLYADLIVSSCCNAIIRSKPYTLEAVKPHLYDIITMSLYGVEKYRNNH